MAIFVVSEAPGVNAEQDQAMIKALDIEGPPPSGARIRIAGPSANGWRILSLRDSQEDFERFRDETLAPAREGSGRSMPSFEIWPWRA